jgi:2-polyprenyl-3-methyl-5-hydroxy-6-metoxy-1,4-benzoquinol methylase
MPNKEMGLASLTKTWSVSTLGKHLRKQGIILTSLWTSNPTSRAKILTLGTMVLGVILVPTCNAECANKKDRSRNLDQNKQWHTLLTQIYKLKLKLGP